MDAERPPIPRFPGGPDPAEPVPRTPVDGFDLNAYARVAAQLADGAEPRSAVLAKARLDESRWLEIEKTWLLRVAISALQQDTSLLCEHGAAMAAAEAALTPAEPPISLDDHAALVAQIEAGRDPSEVAAGAKMSLGEFTRAHRSWAARFAADPALHASFRAKVALLRRA